MVRLALSALLHGLLACTVAAAAKRTLRNTRLTPKPQGYVMAHPPTNNVMVATGNTPVTSMVGTSGVQYENIHEGESPALTRPGVPTTDNSNLKSPAELAAFAASAASYSKSGAAAEPIVAPGLAIISQASPCVKPPCPEAEDAASLNPFFPQPPSSKSPTTKSKSKPEGYILGGLDGGVPTPGINSD